MKKRKKIVFHVVTSLDLGGAVSVATNIASSKNKDYEYHIIEVSRESGLFSHDLLLDLNEKGIAYHRSLIPNRKVGIVLFPFWFLIMFLKYTPDVIHTHAEASNLSVFLFYILFGWLFKKTKYVRTLHNTILWSEWEWIGKIVEPFYLGHHSNVAISKSVQLSYPKFDVDSPPIIYNGVAEVEQKSFLGVDETKINVLFAGRLEYQKGIDELIEIIKRCATISNIKFWIIGSGSYYRKIEESVLGLENVNYREKIYGLSSYLSSFDYLFMPSNFEGLGLMSIEASLAKVPSIINSCAGLWETLPENWPLKVKDNSIEEYMAIFCNLESYDRKELGLIAYNYAKEKFTIEKMQREYEKFYMS